MTYKRARRTTVGSRVKTLKTAASRLGVPLEVSFESIYLTIEKFDSEARSCRTSQ